MADYIQELFDAATEGSDGEPGSFMQRNTGPRVEPQPAGVDMSAGPQAGPVAQQTDRPWYPDQPTQGLALDPVAAGQPSGMPVDYAQAVQSGAQQITGQPVVAPAVQPQAQPGAQQRTTRTWTAPGETAAFTDQDFYPNPQDPAQYNYQTGLEVVARPGRLPMTAISKAAAILNNRQVELDKKKEELQQALIGKQFSTHKSYQQNFSRIIQQENNDFVQSVADAYTGGNVNKAYKVIAGSPQLMAKFRDMNAQYEALGQRGNWLVEQANEYLTNAAANKGHFTKEGAALARDILYGMGGYATGDKTGGDFKKLMDNAKQFENVIGKEKYIVDQVDPHMKEFAKLTTMVDPTTGEPYAFKRGNGYVFLTESNYKDFESQKEVYAREMAYKLGYGSYEEVKKDLDQLYPASYEAKTKMDERTIPSGGGGGSSSGPPVIATANRQYTKADGTKGTERVITRTYKSGEQYKQNAPFEYKDFRNEPVLLSGVELFQQDGKDWMIRGRSVKEPAVAYDAEGNMISLGPDADMRKSGVGNKIVDEAGSKQVVDEAGYFTVPLTGYNEDKLRAQFPDLVQYFTKEQVDAARARGETHDPWSKIEYKVGALVPVRWVLSSQWRAQNPGYDKDSKQKPVEQNTADDPIGIL